MAYQYHKNIDTIVYKNGNQIILVKATDFRNFCNKYGIIMKTSKDFIQYMQIKNKYLPKSLYGII